MRGFYQIPGQKMDILLPESVKHRKTFPLLYLPKPGFRGAFSGFFNKIL